MIQQLCRRVSLFLSNADDKKLVWIGFIVALILRLGVAIVLPADFLSSAMARIDRIQYDTLASNLLDYKVFGFEPGVPDQSLPPGYPAFLGVVYFCLGRSTMGVRIAQSLVGALLVIPVFYLARWIYSNDRRIAVLSMLAIALHPVLILYCQYRLTETFYTLITLTLVLVLSRSLGDLQPRGAGITGLLLGMALLTREILVLFPVVIIVMALARHCSWRQCLVYLLVLVLGISLAMGPWLIRNSMNAGHPTFVTDRSSDAAYMVTGTDVTISPKPGDLAREQRELDFDAARYATFGHMLDPQFFLSAPGYYLWIVGVKLELVWLHPNGLEQMPSGLLRWGYRLEHTLMLLLTFLGVWEVLWQRRWQAWPLIAVWAYTVLVHIFLSTATPRYSIPILPIIILFATDGIFWLWDRVRNQPFAQVD